MRKTMSYRDALVWVERARYTTEAIAFLSLDSKAFAGPDGMHVDLIRDMQLHAIAPGACFSIIFQHS